MPGWRAIAAIGAVAQRALTLSAADDALLEDLSKRSFMFFWEHADPATGIVRDRAQTNGSPVDTNARDVGSIASTGFGLTGLCIAAERGWIPRADAVGRARTTLRSSPSGASGAAGSITSSTSARARASGRASCRRSIAPCRRPLGAPVLRLRRGIVRSATMLGCSRAIRWSFRMAGNRSGFRIRWTITLALVLDADRHRLPPRAAGRHARSLERAESTARRPFARRTRSDTLRHAKAAQDAVPEAALRSRAIDPERVDAEVRRIFDLRSMLETAIDAPGRQTNQPRRFAARRRRTSHRCASLRTSCACFTVDLKRISTPETIEIGAFQHWTSKCS